MTWVDREHAGPASALHALPLPDPVRRERWWMAPDGPALVLGSTQRLDAVDADAAAEHGLEVAQRRSGGGAVLLVPTDITWVDLLLPADDPRWDPDVGRSFWWVGRAWAQALGEVGVTGLSVHEGPPVTTAWSSTICFAGVGAGELLRDGRKVLGLSQRRTRAGARIQCLLVHRWDPGPLVGSLALDADDRRDALAAVEGCAAGVGPLDGAALRAALAAALDAPR
jgi:lipoate-protein ligase A